MSESKKYPMLFNRAGALLGERRFEEALKVWDEIDRLYPHQPDVQLNKIHTLFQLNRKHEATLALVKLLAYEPSNVQAMKHLKEISPIIALSFENISRDVNTLMRLKKIGFAPETIVDVGAYDGHWARFAIRVFPESYFILIDPLEENAAKLNAFCEKNGPNAEYIKALLSDSEKEVDFYVSNVANKTGSTLYPENSNIEQLPVKMPALPLDQVLGGNRRYDFIKLDVQGAEIDILRGSTETLKNTEFIFMEVAMLNYNAGAPLMAETVQFMDGIGFQCIDVGEVLRHTWTFPAQMNLLFIRKGSRFLPKSFLV